MTTPAKPSHGPVLAIAVFGESASVALHPGAAAGSELAIAHETVGQSHSARILALVSRVLAQSGRRPADLAGVAFEAGPGSFTSLRVACALAQGFGLALDVPVCPVGTLEAAAVSLALAQGDVAARGRSEARVFVANDARMGECYFGAFDVEVGAPGDGARVSSLLEVGCDKPSRVADALGQWARRSPGLRFTGDAHERHGELADALARLGIVPLAARADAAAIAMVAAGPGATWLDPVDAAPRYVRDKVALDVDEQRALRAARA